MRAEFLGLSPQPIAFRRVAAECVDGLRALLPLLMSRRARHAAMVPAAGSMVGLMFRSPHQSHYGRACVSFRSVELLYRDSSKNVYDAPHLPPHHHALAYRNL